MAAALIRGSIVWADTLVLKNNVKFQGIAGKTDDGTIELQVSLTGYVYYTPQEIKKIIKGSAKQNAAIRKAWHEKEGDESAKEQAAKQPASAKDPNEPAPCEEASSPVWLTPSQCTALAKRQTVAREKQEKEDAAKAKRQKEKAEAKAKQQEEEDEYHEAANRAKAFRGQDAGDASIPDVTTPDLNPIKRSYGK